MPSDRLVQVQPNLVLVITLPPLDSEDQPYGCKYWYYSCFFTEVSSTSMLKQGIGVWGLKPGVWGLKPGVWGLDPGGSGTGLGPEPWRNGLYFRCPREGSIEQYVF